MSDQQYRIIFDGISDTSEAPRGKNIYYRCVLCGTLLPSQPRDNAACDCWNVRIDIDSHRLLVRDYSSFQAVEKI